MPENLRNELTELLEAVADKAKDPVAGITRLLYSDEWLESQKELKGVMEEAGLKTWFDEVGNLFGRLEAEGGSGETILTGSHVDTVKNGGKLDGMYGVAAGVVALRYLKNKYGAPRRNIECVSFVEEEGSRFPFVFWGSKSFLGIAGKADVENLTDNDGVKFADAANKAGFGFKDDSWKPREDIKGFLEIHIEQGNVLEREGKEVGVVTAIVGQRRYKIKLTGQANHAGTTPMGYREDVLYAASKMISYAIDSAKEKGDPLVTTAGYIEIKPNVPNVVPGEAEFSIDIRHTDSEFLKSFSDGVMAHFEEIAKECKVGISVNRWLDELPVPMDKELVDSFEGVCKELGLNYKVMHSGAGHDAQLMAKHVPTAMLFVPSKDGISHNPAEYTDPVFLEKGLLALIELLRKLAY